MLRSTTVALALSAALAVPAFAGEQVASGAQPEQVAAAIQANAALVQKTQSSAIDAYNGNVNPLAYMLEKVGPYDLEDAFKGANGFPLPGWSQMGNPAAGGGDAGGGGE